MLTQYEQELSILQSNLENLLEKHPSLKQKQQIILQKYALYAQYETIEKLNKEDIISNEVAEHEQSQVMDKLVKSEDSI